MFVGVDFTLDFIARTTGACTMGAATLNHKIRNDAVEVDSVIETRVGEIDKISAGDGHLLNVQLRWSAMRTAVSDKILVVKQSVGKTFRDLPASSHLRLEITHGGLEGSDRHVSWWMQKCLNF